MNISLTVPLESFVKEQVKSGLYTSASEVVRETLRAYYENKKQEEQEKSKLRKLIQEVIDSKSVPLKSAEDLIQLAKEKHNK